MCQAKVFALTGTGIGPREGLRSHQSEDSEGEAVSEEERENRRKLEEELGEDLEMSEDSAEKVRGGGKTSPTTISQDVTVNKAKTADKAFNAMDGYIRG
jgi:hypothetical protein